MSANLIFYILASNYSPRYFFINNIIFAFLFIIFIRIQEHVKREILIYRMISYIEIIKILNYIGSCENNDMTVYF